MKSTLALAATAALVIGSGFVPLTAANATSVANPNDARLFPGAAPTLSNGKQCADSVHDIALPGFITDPSNGYTVGYYTVEESTVVEQGDSFTVLVAPLGSLPYPAKLYYDIDPNQTPQDALSWYFPNCAFIPEPVATIPQPIAPADAVVPDEQPEGATEPGDVAAPTMPTPELNVPAPAESYVAPEVIAPPVAPEQPAQGVQGDVVEPQVKEMPVGGADTGVELAATVTDPVMMAWLGAGVLALLAGAGSVAYARRK